MKLNFWALAGAISAALIAPGFGEQAYAADVNINVFGHRYPFNEYYMEKAMPGKVPGAVVKANLSSFAQFEEKVRISLAAGANELDAIACQGAKVQEYAKNGWLEPIDDLWEKYRGQYKLDDIPTSVVDAMKYKGKLYGVPFGLNVMFLFYRKDLFAEKGVNPPTTMDEYLKLAAMFHTPRRSGAQLTLKPVEAAVNELTWHFNSEGAGWLDDSTFAPTFNQPHGIRAIERLKALAKVSAPGYLTNDNNETTVNFQQDLAVMGLQWASRAASMDNPRQSKVVGKMEFAPPPGRGSRAIVIGYCMTKTSIVDRDLRFRVLMEAASQTSMRGGADFSIPSRLSVMSDPEIQKSNRHFPAAIETIKSARDVPPLPEYSEVGEILVHRVHQAMAGDMGVKEALDTAAREVTEHLRKRGYPVN